MMERFMANCDNDDVMKRIISVLIALSALNLIIPTIFGMAPLLVGNPKNMTISNSPRYLGDPSYQNLYTTPSLVAFANDSWTPGMNYNMTQGSSFSPYNMYYSNPYNPNSSITGLFEVPPAATSYLTQNMTPIPTIGMEGYYAQPQMRMHVMN